MILVEVPRGVLKVGDYVRRKGSPWVGQIISPMAYCEGSSLWNWRWSAPWPSDLRFLGNIRMGDTRFETDWEYNLEQEFLDLSTPISKDSEEG
jgi:hypothetical protein